VYALGVRRDTAASIGHSHSPALRSLFFGAPVGGEYAPLSARQRASLDRNLRLMLLLFCCSIVFASMVFDSLTGAVCAQRKGRDRITFMAFTLFVSL